MAARWNAEQSARLARFGRPLQGDRPFAAEGALRRREEEENQKKKMVEVTILPEYQRHEKVFSKEGAKRFPPSWPKDHTIKLKLGAPEELKCKVYPLTKAEREATQNFI